MAHRKERDLGPHQHAEGGHGDTTHRRFVEQLHESTTPDTDDSPEGRAAEAKGRPVEGHHRLHEDRDQHDEAEKDSEKTRAEREVRRDNVDENVLKRARVPHGGDSR